MNHKIVWYAIINYKLINLKLTAFKNCGDYLIEENADGPIFNVSVLDKF